MSRSAVTALGPENIEEFKSFDDVVFIGYIASGDYTARQSLSAVAQKYRAEFTFGLVSDQAVIQAENMELPTVVCHIVGDGETRSFSAFSEPEALDRFVSEASRRIIGDFTRQNQQRLLDVSDRRDHAYFDATNMLSRSVVGPWYMYSERPKMTEQNFVGHSTILRNATMTL